MQNLLMRTPAVFESWSGPNPNGPFTKSTQPASSHYLRRNQSGYTGAKPKTRPLPYHAYAFEHVDCKAVHEYENIQLGTNWKGFGGGPMLHNSTTNWVIFDPDPSTLDSSLINRALEKLTEQVRGDLDISVDLAEARKTAKMFSVADQVVDFTKTFQRKYGLLKSLSSTYLQYIYGVKPLLSTIHGLADENLRVVINKTAHLRARASTVFVPKTMRVNTIFGDWTNPVKSSNLKRSVTFGVDMRDDQWDPARFSSLNPLSIAWELTPYSFVVDWFLNVGGYLRQMETYCLYANKFRGGYVTKLTVGDAFFDWGRTSIPGYSITKDRFYGYGRTTKITRDLLLSYPAPSFPSLDARLGSSRLFSSAALLAQQLGRR